MYVIRAENPNQALSFGLHYLKHEGIRNDSRNGPVIESPGPVTTVFTRPWQRVLISKTRDANPFFHLMESLWILAGREDVGFLTNFNKRMAEYSDNGVTFNAPYGYRIRNDGAGWLSVPPRDQLQCVIDLLATDPNSRQAVIQIWDSCDLVKDTKDKACNMSIVFRVINAHLCMTVYNRSNDVIWGAYGANVVQFSMIQEYVAAHLGLPLGPYHQVSNNYHVYTEGPAGELLSRLKNFPAHDPYEQVFNQIFITDAELFDDDLNNFFYQYDSSFLTGCLTCDYQSEYFKHLVIPMLHTWMRRSDRAEAKQYAYAEILSDDWKQAAIDWLEVREEREKGNASK